MTSEMQVWACSLRPPDCIVGESPGHVVNSSLLSALVNMVARRLVVQNVSSASEHSL